MAAGQGGVVDFELTAAWIAEEWALFVETMAQKLPDHTRNQADPPRRQGQPGGDRRGQYGAYNGRQDDRRNAGH
jgi:hypothetical protein